MSLSRREALRAGACAVVAIPALPNFLVAEWHRAVVSGNVERPYLDGALRVERWLRSVAFDTPAGRAWPRTPGHILRSRPDSFLYSGTPGVVLFYLDLFESTKEQRFLDEAVRGALEIAASLPSVSVPLSRAGLYAGLAGQVIVIDKVHAASGREELKNAAASGARLVAEAYAAPKPEPNEVTDIVSGTAGAGLALLAMKHLIGDRAIASARNAGDRLIVSGLAAGDGQRRWLMTPASPRELPNFSHGTAGVAYFLATLYQATDAVKYRNGAMDGARYLESLMVPSGREGRLIRHNSTDEGKDLFYLSWCHGPAGTGRLWDRLHAVERSSKWRDHENRGALGIIAQGVPENRTAGFWNNISQCCGNAGVADYFLARHRRTAAADDLAYAKRHADDLLKSGTVENDTQRWVQAENRVSPTAVEAQTGWMQGAAGVAAMLLRLDAAVAGAPAPMASRLPDSPW
jgi:lantibiotic modifying enzyme